MFHTYIVMGAAICVLLYVLIELFLATRPSGIWGLILPLGFLALALMGITDTAPHIFGLEYNATALHSFTKVGLIGCLSALGVYLISRILYINTMRAKRRRLQAAMAARKARQQQAATRQSEQELKLNYDPNRLFQ